MRTQVSERLERLFAARREADRDEEARRLAEVAEKAPHVLALSRKRVQLIMDGVRRIANREGTGPSLPERMAALNREVAEALTAAGFPADYLDPVYQCPLCEDRGFVGDTIREPCACRQRAYYQLLSADMGFQGGETATFAAFDLNVFPDERLAEIQGLANPGRLTQRGLMRMNRQKCEQWADSVPDAAQHTALLCGRSGLGKTYLLRCMAVRLIERQQEVMAVTAYAWLEAARKAYFGQEEDDGDLAAMMEAEILMLDDLGSEPLLQNVTVEQLFQLLSQRQAAGRFTVISTNLTPANLQARYTERIASRLLDREGCLIVPFEGEDIRRVRKTR